MNSESLPPEENPATGAPISESGSKSSAGEKLPFHIPAILLEDDDSQPEDFREDAQKFSPGQKASAGQLETEGELPESYGTKKLLLTARDPHWLYAHWDLTHEQQHQYCAQSADGRLTLRVHREDLIEPPAAEIHVHPDARHWFVHVPQSGTRYNAELGCHTSSGEWVSISTSAPTFAPPGKMSPSTSVEFATIPFETPMPELLALAGGAASQNLSLTEALEKLRGQGHPDLPAAPAVTAWTERQARALAEISNPQVTPRIFPSSFTLAETISPSSYELPANIESPTSPGGISSPFGGAQPQKKFWFNVNAELIVYGATEPNATVTIGGWPVQLRSDGSFSFRFALPDGNYELPVVAVSADQSDGRVADLKFTRTTERSGDVGTHPQDPKLKPPAPENL